MIRWQCSFVVLILVVNSLQFGNGSQELVKCSTSDDSCDLPCVDKITDKIVKLLGEQNAAHDMGIVEKVEGQLVKLERIIEERIAKIETLLARSTSSFTENTVQGVLVPVGPKNETAFQPITTTSKTIDKDTDKPGSSKTTPNDLNECINQKIKEWKSDQRKRCPETATMATEIPPSPTSSTVKNGSEDPYGTVTVPSILQKPITPSEESGTEDSVEETTEVISENLPTTKKSKIDELPDSSTQSIENNGSKVSPETTTENAHQENVPVFVDPVTTTTKKYEYALPKNTIPTKKNVQSWIRTRNPNIHFPTESPYEIATTQTPPKYLPNAPEVFNYSRDFLNDSWTIIHSRFDGMISFNRSWSEYRTPFGRLPDEYWAGLEAIHQLTKSGDYELLVLLKGFDGSVKTALYDSFWVGSETTNYRLALGPFVSGDAGDSLSGSSGQMFSTYDRDNDRLLCASCGQIYHSGWWFKDCGDANLNGLYTSSVEKEETSYGVSMNWWSFGRDYQGLQEAAMLIRKRAR